MHSTPKGKAMSMATKIILFSIMMSGTAHAGTKPVKAKYIECIHGDTCTFTMSLGFGVSVTRKIRLCDVQAVGKYRDDASRARGAARWLSSRLARAKNITLHVPYSGQCESNTCEEQSDNLILAWVIADGEVINDALLREGYAIDSPSECRR